MKDVMNDPILKQLDEDFIKDTKLMKQFRDDTIESLKCHPGYNTYVADQIEGDEDICVMIDDIDVQIPVDEFMN